MTLLVHAAASLMMAGVIWSVQLVQYPLFRTVGRDHWHRYHARHVQSIGLVVGPLMTLELFTGALLVFENADPLALVNLVLIVALWVTTAMVQMPLHRRLAQRFDSAAMSRLVAGNWIRTGIWSIHALIVLRMLATS
ncbi:MAG: hypothetical protein ACYTHK_11080 [Planctomycetota bacterium]|jgi:hypothetical protein